MSARLKSLRVPSRAMSAGHPAAVYGKGYDQPDDDDRQAGDDAHDDLGQHPGRKDRRQTANQQQQTEETEEEEQFDDASDGGSFKELRRTWQEGGEEPVQAHSSRQILLHVLELSSFRIERNK